MQAETMVLPALCVWSVAIGHTLARARLLQYLDTHLVALNSNECHALVDRLICRSISYLLAPAQCLTDSFMNFYGS